MEFLTNKKAFSGTLAALLLLGVGQVSADQTWTDAIADQNMNTAGNWSPGAALPTGVNAIIPTTLGATQPELPAAPVAGLTPSGLIFTGTDGIFLYTQGGTPLVVGVNGVTVTNSATNPAVITLGANQIGTVEDNGALHIVGPASTGGFTVNYVFANTSTGNTLTLDEGQTSGSLANVSMGTGASLGGSLILTTSMTLNDISSPSSPNTDVIELGGSLTFGSLDDTTINAQIENYLTNHGALVKEGLGSVTISNGANSYDGGTNLNSGTVVITTATTFANQLGAPSSVSQSNTISFDGGTLQVGTTSTTPYTLLNPINVASFGGTLDTFGNTVTQGTLILPTLTNPLSGTGQLEIANSSANPPGYLVLTLDNSAFAGTFLVDATAALEGTVNANSIPSVPIIDNGIVQFNQQTAVTYSSGISGTGDVLVGSPTNTGTILTYTGTNTYTGGTTIYSGNTLIGNGNNFPQDAVNGITVDAGGTLDFDQTSNNTYAGIINGAGTVTMAGSGTNTLFLTGDSSAFAGTVNIAEGNMNFNTPTSALGGNFNVSGTGILSGIGTVSGSSFTTTVSGGTVAPGNGAPGILNVAGAYVQNGGTLLIDIVGQGNVPGVGGNNSELVIAGTSSLNPTATVSVDSLDGSFFIGGAYTIEHSVGALTGTYNPIVMTNTTLTPVLTYDDHNVYLDYRPAILECACSENGENVLFQLFTVSTPTGDLAVFLADLTSLTCPEIGVVLEELSGSAYADHINGVELSTHQFVRRLLDPVRLFLARDLDCCNSCDCCCNDGVDVWVEAGGIQADFKRDHNHRHGGGSCHRRGFKASGWQITGGAQMEACDHTWVAGAAVTYENLTNDSHHHHSGKFDTNTVMGGLYGAYRLCDFYLMGDLVFGGSESNMKRHIFLGDEEFHHKGKPEALQGILYAELGYDLRYCSFLIQPFLGLEGGYYNFKNSKEHHGFPTDIHFKERSFGTFDTRLGAHFAMDEVACGLFIGVDLAWQYRCSENNDYLQARFRDFGGEFRVNGVTLDRNSFEAAVNVEQKIGDNWSIYATGFWQQWTSNSYAYDILGGIAFNF